MGGVGYDKGDDKLFQHVSAMVVHCVRVGAACGGVMRSQVRNDAAAVQGAEAAIIIKFYFHNTQQHLCNVTGCLEPIGPVCFPVVRWPLHIHTRACSFVRRCHRAAHH
jgi:hypothetical protein